MGVIYIVHHQPPNRLCIKNCKGFLSQNCLFTCNFFFLFIYALTGWEGSATDAHIREDAVKHDLIISAGKYFLTNAGFPLCNWLLVPYQGVCYHLVEWGHANIRPRTKEELFCSQCHWTYIWCIETLISHSAPGTWIFTWNSNLNSSSTLCCA